jgi:glycosyltransferase involved in cell wall biosynthesis
MQKLAPTEDGLRMSKHQILIVVQLDPLGDRVGGIGSYVQGWIEHCPTGFELTICCLTKDPSQKLGSIYKVQDDSGRVLSLLPILRVKDDNKKSPIPLALSFGLALFRYSKVIKTFHHVFCQRDDYVLPLAFKGIRSHLIIHNDVTLLLDSNYSESIWSRIRLIYPYYMRFLMGFTDSIYSVSNKTIDYLKSISGRRTVDLTHVHTWADPDAFHPLAGATVEDMRSTQAQRFSLDSTKKWLLFIGRFQKQKNLSLILESLVGQELNYEMIFIGAGDLESSLKKLAQELDLGAVHFIGRHPRQEIAKFLQVSDLWISSSNFEGMSIALMEALLSGIPVLTTDTGEVSQLDLDLTLSTIVKVGDSKGFRTALSHYISGSKGLPPGSRSPGIDPIKYGAKSSIDKVIHGFIQYS